MPQKMTGRPVILLLFTGYCGISKKPKILHRFTCLVGRGLAPAVITVKVRQIGGSKPPPYHDLDISQ